MQKQAPLGFVFVPQLLCHCGLLLSCQDFLPLCGLLGLTLASQHF